MLVDFDVKGQQGMGYITAESIIMDNGHRSRSISDSLKFNQLDDGFVSYKYAAFYFRRD